MSAEMVGKLTVGSHESKIQNGVIDRADRRRNERTQVAARIAHLG